MSDLTTGSIPRHLVRQALPMMLGMLFQTLYYLIDLWFVARLGDAAVAGVSAAGNVQFIVMALTQVLAVGTMALIAHAVGRRDMADASVVFNQSTTWALVCGALTLVLGYALGGRYLATVGSDPAVREAGMAYLRGYLPGLALQFAFVSMSSALRGVGVVRPGMLVQMLSVVLNIVFAPVLIAGWGTGRPLGTFGAGLATTLAIAGALLVMVGFFLRLDTGVRFDRALLRPQWPVLARLLKIGVPPGVEFALMFVFTGIVYYAIRGFGPVAQAGYGIGARVMQAIFLPAMAVSFAAAPLAGQNMGARHPERVRATFRWAASVGAGLMLALTLLCQWRPDWLILGITTEAPVVAVASDFLRTVSWNFAATGLLFTCSGLFQAMGNTIPSLVSSALRLVTFAGPVLWLSTRAGFQLAHVWWTSVITLTLQAALTWWLLQREFARRLPGLAAPAPAPTPA